MKLAYTGSFDPFTNGHEHIVEKALGLGAEIVVIVANNPNKKHHFPSELRAKMVKKCIPEVEVLILPDRTYAVEFAHSLGCVGMVRGIRTEQDFQDEVGVYQANKLIKPEMESVYIMPDINLSSVRSSLVMSLVGAHDWIWAVKQIVPEFVMLQICKKFCLEYCSLKGDERYIDFQNHNEDFNAFTEYDTNPYHNWEHIAYCLMEFHKINGNNNKNVDLGILFHDTFDPNDTTRLRKFLEFNNYITNWPELVISVVGATNHGHPMDFENKDMRIKDLIKIVHDIDLSVLSWPPDRYESYAKAIRKEYVEVKGVQKDEFIEGRIKFLKSMIRKNPYLTNNYSVVEAGLNMAWELEELFEERSNP